MRPQTLLLAGAWAFCACIGLAQECTNEVDGSVLVWIAAGDFEMGSENGDADESPITNVRVPGFWLGKYEVTNEQYARYLKATGKDAPRFWEQEKFRNPRQPVVGLSWSDAAAYCKWAGLRMPSEIEWEYGAKGGRNFVYPTATGVINPDSACYDDTDKDRHRDAPDPVGRYCPNPFGLYDMAGNAWEWTASRYGKYPAAVEGKEQATPRERSPFRVMRGGCWAFPAYYCRTTHRHRFREHLVYDYVGVRVAKSKEPAELRPDDTAGRSAGSVAP